MEVKVLNIVLVVFCGALMILGVAELVRLVVFWWVRPEKPGDFTLVVAPETPEECESLVRSAAERMRWLDLKGPCGLICLNKDEDQEILKICRFLALRYPYLKVSKQEDLVYNILETKEAP